MELTQGCNRALLLSGMTAKRQTISKKHGVSFETAETVFDDPNARVSDEPDHSDNEERAIIIGYAATHQMLSISYAARGERIRLISARPATREERRTYEQAND